MPASSTYQPALDGATLRHSAEIFTYVQIGAQLGAVNTPSLLVRLADPTKCGNRCLQVHLTGPARVTVLVSTPSARCQLLCVFRRSRPSFRFEAGHFSDVNQCCEIVPLRSGRVLLSSWAANFTCLADALAAERLHIE